MGRPFFAHRICYYLSLLLLLKTAFAELDLANECSVVQLDKPYYQGSYKISPSSNCGLFRFEKTPVGYEGSTNSQVIFVTVYNVTVAPVFGIPVTDEEETDNTKAHLSQYCDCSVCVAALDSEVPSGNSTLEHQIAENLDCLPSLSGQGRHLAIPTGGRLLIVAKKQSNIYAFKFSFKYIYDVVCPNENDPFPDQPRVAQWCSSPDYKYNKGQQTCIAHEWQCDGVADCIDASDERCCPPQFTQCHSWDGTNSKCVPRCNGYTECEEDGVSSFSTDCRLPECAEPNLSCQVPSDDPLGGGYQCLASDRRCNGLIECADGRDEVGCQPSVCNPENGTYLCEADTMGHCIRQEFVCDGQWHCPNGDDEYYCPLLSRRLNLVLCLSGLFSCASVLFVIAYFHRRYCMTYRRSRSRHRRRRFDLLSPVEQAARYFMQMCGAPPSYNQIMQLGGQPGEFDANTPIPEIQSVGNEHAATIDVVQSSSVPNQHRINSYDDESSEIEYLSELHFPDQNGTSLPPFGVTRSGNEVTSRPEDQAEYAECSDEPPMAPPFSTSLNSATSESDRSHHFELRATNSSSSTLQSHLSSNIEDSQQQGRSSSDAHQDTSS